MTDAHAPSEVKASILRLQALAVKLRAERFAQGSVQLTKTKLAFKLNEATGQPDRCFAYPIRDSNRLVEEFMLLANRAVAAALCRAFPDRALLRRHAPPLPHKLAAAVRGAAKHKLDVRAGSSRELMESLAALRATLPRAQFYGVQQLLTAPMTTAKYICTGDVPPPEYLHYALNFATYTHFTSPIRRYADLVVHRQLAAALAGAAAPLTPLAVSQQADQCNDRKAAAGAAQVASDNLFMCLFLQAQGPFVVDAVVTRVQDRSVDVSIPTFGVDARVRLDDHPTLSDKGYAHEVLTLRWASGETQRVAQLDVVKVWLSAEVSNNRIDKVVHLATPAQAAAAPADAGSAVATEGAPEHHDDD